MRHVKDLFILVIVFACIAEAVHVAVSICTDPVTSIIYVLAGVLWGALCARVQTITFHERRLWVIGCCFVANAIVWPLAMLLGIFRARWGTKRLRRNCDAREQHIEPSPRGAG